MSYTTEGDVRSSARRAALVVWFVGALTMAGCGTDSSMSPTTSTTPSTPPASPSGPPTTLSDPPATLPPLGDTFTVSCCTTPPSIESELSINFCGPFEVSGEVHNEMLFTSTYSIEAAGTDGGGEPVFTTVVELTAVTGGESRGWQALAPASIGRSVIVASFGCRATATKHRTDTIEAAAAVRVAFQHRATEFCQRSQLEFGEQQPLIAQLRELNTVPEDQTAFIEALDKWLAFEDAIAAHGSIGGVYANDNSALQGAFEANAILSELVPACARIPNGR